MRAFIPEIILLLLALSMMAMQPGWKKSATDAPRALASIAVVGWILALLCLGFQTNIPSGLQPNSLSPTQASPLGLYSLAPWTQAFKFIFLASGAATAGLMGLYHRQGGSLRGDNLAPGASHALLAFSGIGMCLIVSAQDLLLFFIGLELATLPLIALVGIPSGDKRSVEGGLKFLLLGGISSATTLMGIALLYGAWGGITFAHAPALTVRPDALLLTGGILVVAGILFKLAAAPFHVWAPDAYEAAPTPVMAFLSTGSKAAAVAALVALLQGPLQSLRESLTPAFVIVCMISLVIGNLGAMRQVQRGKNLRRFFAYTSIAQAGFFLLAFIGPAELTIWAVLGNSLAYAAGSFAVYFVLASIAKEGDETFSSLAGLHTRQPVMAFTLLVGAFSLAGVPPLVGFYGKYLLFASIAAAEDYGLLAFALASAVFSAYYYLQLVKSAYRPASETLPDLRLRPELKWSAIFFTLAVVVLGIWPGWLEFLRLAAMP
jgi:NADH-quinone oxidoreductase subunit N